MCEGPLESYGAIISGKRPKEERTLCIIAFCTSTVSTAGAQRTLKLCPNKHANSDCLYHDHLGLTPYYAPSIFPRRYYHYCFVQELPSLAASLGQTKAMLSGTTHKVSRPATSSRKQMGGESLAQDRIPR